ncbi:hypothetical protein A3B45_02560 [Candidatus Daviesbacteria bacterium RIFCSPLOWO2_01_FULL_39_12]|uniref:Uncharacterized protein n=1 Tax=Candidatus Daviesbacteria bacterium RIFCSPLOWO2_01_FULL_39_12 TaxID=1797785 RepID=A0A1F5KSI8_9BACT|nr:MAG: hypothetical protein A3D79_00270 [Candidatus Daviesbacteria bacterium RIFCSPHIGHO2_02_FULL_39_8]OGE43888.1 MAG: hypothetical protein A3B45_02560 [Candidatus Daviesbacteria bacterium RIFCSPLOWO2_01_FULL_39_12]
MASIEDLSGRDYPPRLPLIDAAKDFIDKIVTAHPFPWGDRKGPPHYRETAVGVYDWPEEPKRWQVFSGKVLHWARGTERFIDDINHNRITF